jgi:hypothetical protein
VYLQIILLFHSKHDTVFRARGADGDCQRKNDLLVDLSKHHWHVVNQSFWEPQSQLLLGILNAVRSMDDVAPDVNAIGSTDASWFSGQRVSGPDDLPGLLNNILSLESNCNNWSGGDVLDQGWEESLGGEIRVVSLGQLLWHIHELQPTKGVSLGHKSVDDRGHESALDTVWLDHNVGSLHVAERAGTMSVAMHREKVIHGL